MRCPSQGLFGLFHPNVVYRIQRAGWLHDVSIVWPGRSRFRSRPAARRLTTTDFSAFSRCATSTRQLPLSRRFRLRELWKPKRHEFIRSDECSPLEPQASVSRPLRVRRPRPFESAPVAWRFHPTTRPYVHQPCRHVEVVVRPKLCRSSVRRWSGVASDRVSLSEDSSTNAQPSVRLPLAEASCSRRVDISRHVAVGRLPESPLTTDTRGCSGRRAPSAASDHAYAWR